MQSSIKNISPLLSSFNRDQAEEAIKTHLSGLLTPEKGLKKSDFSSQEDVLCGVRPFKKMYFASEPQTAYVFGTNCLERFLGAEYLQKAIEDHQLSSLQAVPTKYLFMEKETVKVTVSYDAIARVPTLDSQEFRSLSEYVGDEKVRWSDLTTTESNDLTKLRICTGFNDYAGAPIANIRRHNGKLCVIDTEYRSFEGPKNDTSPITEYHFKETHFTYQASEFGL